MRLFFYLGGRCLGTVALVHSALVVVVVLLRLVENVGDLARQPNAAELTLQLALLAAVEHAYQVLPMACFMGVLVAGTQLAQRGEMLGLQAAGWGLGLSCGPFLAVALVLGLAGAALGETVLPRVVARQAHLQVGGGDALSRFYGRTLHWFRDGAMMLHLPEPMSAQPPAFADPSLYRLAAGQLTEVLRGRRLVHDGQSWWLDDAVVRQVGSLEVQRLTRLRLDLSVQPNDLGDVMGNPRALPYAEVRALLARRQRAGFETAAHALELHQRWTYPLGTLGLVLVGLPWATDPNRRRSLTAVLGAGAGLMALYLASVQLLRLLALAHRIAPGLGAWGALLLWGGLAPISWRVHRRLA